MDIKYNTDTKIEDNARLYQLQKANFDQEVNTAVSVWLLLHMNALNEIDLYRCYTSLLLNHLESRGPVSLWTPSGEDKAADTKRRDTDRSRGKA